MTRSCRNVLHAVPNRAACLSNRWHRLGTAVVSEDGGNTVLRLTPDELNYRAGRAEYERVK